MESQRQQTVDITEMSPPMLSVNNEETVRPSVASSSSTRAKFIAAKAKAAALEVRASFLKVKQALRIADEELGLKQQIAEVKMEEQIYGRYNEQELNDSAGVIKSIDCKDCPNVILNKDPINIIRKLVKGTLRPQNKCCLDERS